MLSGVIHLDVGGAHFTTSIATLTRDPQSLLARVAYEHWLKDPATSQQPIFIDRDGTHFRYVLNWLRDGPSAVFPDDRQTILELINEVSFFGIPDLKTALRARLPGNVGVPGSGTTSIGAPPATSCETDSAGSTFDPVSLPHCLVTTTNAKLTNPHCPVSMPNSGGSSTAAKTSAIVVQGLESPPDSIENGGGNSTFTDPSDVSSPALALPTPTSDEDPVINTKTGGQRSKVVALGPHRCRVTLGIPSAVTPDVIPPVNGILASADVCRTLRTGDLVKWRHEEFSGVLFLPIVRALAKQGYVDWLVCSMCGNDFELRLPERKAMVEGFSALKNFLEDMVGRIDCTANDSCVYVTWRNAVCAKDGYIDSIRFSMHTPLKALQLAV